AEEIDVSPHTGRHLETYFEVMRKAVERFDEASNAATDNAGRQAALDELNSFLDAARYALANRDLVANAPAGMTPEAANAENIKGFAGDSDAYREQYANQIKNFNDAVRSAANVAGFPDLIRWAALWPTGNGVTASARASLQHRRTPEVAPTHAVD